MTLKLEKRKETQFGSSVTESQVNSGKYNSKKKIMANYVTSLHLISLHSLPPKKNQYKYLIRCNANIRKLIYKKQVTRKKSVKRYCESKFIFIVILFLFAKNRARIYRVEFLVCFIRSVWQLLIYLYTWHMVSLLKIYVEFGKCLK